MINRETENASFTHSTESYLILVQSGCISLICLWKYSLTYYTKIFIHLKLHSLCDSPDLVWSYIKRLAGFGMLSSWLIHESIIYFLFFIIFYLRIVLKWIGPEFCASSFYLLFRIAVIPVFPVFENFTSSMQFLKVVINGCGNASVIPWTI